MFGSSLSLQVPRGVGVRGSIVDHPKWRSVTEVLRGFFHVQEAG